MNRDKTISIGNWSIRWSLVDLILYPGLFALFLNMAFNMNFNGGKTKYGGEFWSDKGAYYIYLPATFINGFAIGNYPDSIDYRHAYGFILDKETGKVRTKVTYGVSLFALPFFLPTHWLASWFQLEPDGFSIIYHRMAVVCGIFYLILSMFILKQLFRFYFPVWLSYALPFILLLSTNLWFYGMDDVLMSHLYSFFLISLFLLTFKTYLVREMKPLWILMALGFIMALLVLIRPTNIFMMLILVFWDAGSWKEILMRIKHFLRFKPILIFLTAFAVVFLPQLLYWHFLSGKWVYYSYPGETFANWKHPMLIPFWFSPLNGLFPYTPAAILFVAGVVVMMGKRIRNGIFLLVIFLGYSYLYSSWGSWYFGGSFGCRVMVEMYALFSFAMGYFILFFMQRRNLFMKLIPVVLVACFIHFNQRLYYRKTFYIGGTWSWEDYKDQLRKAELYDFTRTDYTYTNDFENTSVYLGFHPAFQRLRSGTRSTYVNQEIRYNCTYERVLGTILDTGNVRQVSVSVWVNTLDSARTGAVFVCCIEDFSRDEILNKTVLIDGFHPEPGKWTEVNFTVEVPDSLDGNQFIRFYLENREKARFYIDDLTIHFE